MTKLNLKGILYMKKFLLIFSLMTFITTSAFANCNYVGLCTPYPYNLSSKKWQIISMRLGGTLLSEKIAEARVKEELKKITKQKFDVSVKSYSLQDLLSGRFKSITISGKNLDINGVYLTSLELKTLCDFNYVQFDKNPIQFKENMIMGFSTVISDEDLMKTMHSSGYLNKLNCVNVHGCGITFFKLSGAGVNLENNKLHFKIRVTSQLLLEKPLDIDMSTDLNAKNGRIVLTKIDLKNVVKGVDLSKVANQLNSFNPLTFSLEVLENKNTKMCINSVEIVGNKIMINGNIFIPKTDT